MLMAASLHCDCRAKIETRLSVLKCRLTSRLCDLQVTWSLCFSFFIYNGDIIELLQRFKTLMYLKCLWQCVAHSKCCFIDFVVLFFYCPHEFNYFTNVFLTSLDISNLSILMGTCQQWISVWKMYGSFQCTLSKN
jgi:NADH:ubiquinone oxidoreductase subunit B-like Fe-S oxidoreductase